MLGLEKVYKVLFDYFQTQTVAQEEYWKQNRGVACHSQHYFIISYVFIFSLITVHKGWRSKGHLGIHTSQEISLIGQPRPSDNDDISF